MMFSLEGFEIGILLAIGYILGYATALHREVNRKKKDALVSQSTKEEKSE